MFSPQQAYLLDGSKYKMINIFWMSHILQTILRALRRVTQQQNMTKKDSIGHIAQWYADCYS